MSVWCCVIFGVVPTTCVGFCSRGLSRPRVCGFPFPGFVPTTCVWVSVPGVCPDHVCVGFRSRGLSRPRVCGFPFPGFVPTTCVWVSVPGVCPDHVCVGFRSRGLSRPRVCGFPFPGFVPTTCVWVYSSLWSFHSKAGCLSMASSTLWGTFPVASRLNPTAAKDSCRRVPL